MLRSFAKQIHGMLSGMNGEVVVVTMVGQQLSDSSLNRGYFFYFKTSEN